MKITKLIASTLVATGLASASFAGTLTEPAVEQELEEVAAPSSSGGIILPLLLLLAVGAAVASSGSDSESNL